MPAKRKQVRRNIDLAFDVARQVMTHPDRFPDQFVVIPLDVEVTARLFSRERVRLLRLVRERGSFSSVSELAAKLHRDQTRVSRDLGDLARAGLVSIARRGKSKVIQSSDRPIVVA